jgi:hypothetical protein
VSFLQTLAEQRKKFLEGLDANEGDINLDIFEDFYPDRAHFVFELLQNAEDAGATAATFTLSSGGCSFQHDGTPFTERNVRAITGIHNTTKDKSPDQIGKFGVGFKSVFVYTLTPIIFSGDFSFKISRLVLPEPVARDSQIGSKTSFWFPFNSSKKTPEDAYNEIATALGALAETTLLFLSKIKSIRWQIGTVASGEVLSVQHSDNHFEVLKQIGGKTTTSSHFLKFDQPVEGQEKHKTAVAFELDLLPNALEFDPTKPIAKQLKIIPAKQGRVAVFFPAEKETSGLRFHLHAPFVPELSRASVKETPVNHPLFQQLATLASASLHQIRDLGLLTIEFLSVLPNPQDAIPPRYQGIRARIVEAMNTQPLTPTHGKAHAPAKTLLQAKASLKDLLSAEDIEFLVDYQEQAPQWAIGATLRNNNADRFLTGLAIREWDIENFVKLLCKQATENSWQKPDTEFMVWFEAKSIEWLQQLYALLYTELEPTGGLSRISDLRIIRLVNGNYSVGKKSFFASDGVDHDDDVLPRADSRLYTTGKARTVQQNARTFLEKVGVREVGEAEQVEAILTQRYAKANLKPRKGDLKRFIDLIEKDASKAKLFEESFIFECNDGWRKPSGVFLDRPFMDTGLTVYYAAFNRMATRRPLAKSYLTSGVGFKRLAKFGETVGAQTRLEIQEVSCFSNPDWSYLSSVGGGRSRSPINRDYDIPSLKALLAAPASLELSKLLWQTMASLPQYPNYLRATFQINQSSGYHSADSQLVQNLRVAEWVPQNSNSFVRPADAARELLPEGFPFDPGWPWLQAIHFGWEVAKKSKEQLEKQAAAKDLGFADSDTLERAKRFATLPAEEQERILADHGRSEAAKLPEHEPANPERRAERVGAQAADAPERRTEPRTRSVSIGREGVKQETAEYLRGQYTNGNGEMICQICKGPLPFKLDDGSDFFEKVEFLPELKKHHYQNYLALCPNHAAMFQHANGSADRMLTTFLEFTGNELEVVLAQKDNKVYFTKTHVADLRAVIQEEIDHSDTKSAGEKLEESL